MYGVRHSEVSSLPKAELSALSSFWTFLKPYRVRALLAAGLVLLSSMAVLAIGGALRYLVDAGISKGDTLLLDRAYEIFLGVVVALALVSFGRHFLLSWLGERIVADIRNRVYEKITSMHIGFFESTRTGELLSRLTTDTTVLQTVLTSALPIALRNSLLFLGGISLLLFTSAQLTGYVFVIMPLVVLPIILLGRKVRSLSRDTQQKVADLNAHAEETINAVRTVQAMTMENMVRTVFSRLVGEAMATAMDRVRMRALLTSLVIMLIFGAVVTVLWIGGHEVIRGNITPGELSSFVFYAVIVAGAVGAISDVLADLQRAAGASERLKELLSLESEIKSPDKPLSITNPESSSIILENITFSYPSRKDVSTVGDISFAIAPGEVVALVGPSGAGKSTLFQLLLRHYDPDMGSIKLNGVDIRQFDLTEYRRLIGLVPQEPVIFSDSAENNIRAGNPDASEQQVIDAARAAGAYDFIAALPDGFATHLGEKGVKLSGGQRQRIAIARAIVRNPNILLLDEATSALDSESELLVQKGLKRLMEGRTTLVIAHRLSTVRNANRIVVLSEGGIEKIGTHEELLNQSVTYKRFFELQSLKAADN